jgi:uncharacterized damage-inducible protein DinB
MSLNNEEVLEEFDLEMAAVRKTLERIPEDKLTWKPHDKSMLLGRLAGHLAELPRFGATALTTEKFDLASRPADYKPLIAESQKHVVAEFDKNVAHARQLIASATDQDWSKTWTLSFGDRKIFHGSRKGAFRRMLMNHVIHHRAQLGVYLRLNNVPVPSTYGPSADEGLR